MVFVGFVDDHAVVVVAVVDVVAVVVVVVFACKLFIFS